MEAQGKTREEEQKDFFRENCYLLVRDFFSEEQVRLLRRYADEMGEQSQRVLNAAPQSSMDINSFQNAFKGLIVVPEKEKPNQVCRVEDMLSYSRGLYHLVLGSVTPFISDVLGEEYVPFKDKLNFKWPGGGAFKPHQDYPAYDLFGPKEHVTAMISIDPSTLENGCLKVAHNYRKPLIANERIEQKSLLLGKPIIPYNGDTMEQEFVDVFDWRPIATMPRDLLIFDSYVPHASEANASNFPRRAMFITHNRLAEGEWRKAYYDLKRRDPLNPKFHFANPTTKREEK